MHVPNAVSWVQRFSVSFHKDVPWGNQEGSEQ